MDIFGEQWLDHPGKIARAWDAAVGADDVVLLVGDISWAHRPEEVRPDLEFLAARPGRLKVLLRGNHDSWWRSISSVRGLLPEGMAAIQNDALRLVDPDGGRGVVLCGARGWNAPGMPWSDPENDPPVYERELRRLEMSLGAAAELREPDDALVAMLHYPPLGPDETDSEVLGRLVDAGVDVAAYGHLHGEADHAWAPRGRYQGVRVIFAAADFTGFTPVEVFPGES